MIMRLQIKVCAILALVLLLSAGERFGMTGAYATGNPFAAGDGTEADPYRIETPEQLSAVRHFPEEAVFFELGADIDLTAYVSEGGDGYNDGEGWVPIGTDCYSRTPGSFNGSFDGKEHTVMGLRMNRTEDDFQALFACTGSNSTIKNINLVETDVTGGTIVGSLVGRNEGFVANAGSAGSIYGSNHVGGLVGSNKGTIEDAYAEAQVDGGTHVGGLIGENLDSGTVTGSYATGAVTASNHTVGGLVGSNLGNVSRSYATGNVRGESHTVGGLLGTSSEGTVDDVYASGDVAGNSEVGGLIGFSSGNSITNSHALGDVTAIENNAGGLIGLSEDEAVTESYATGEVKGYSCVGGFIGYLKGTVENVFALGDVHGTLVVGGLVGYSEGSEVRKSFAAGDVSSGDANGGGLVGLNDAGTIADTYARGDVTVIRGGGGLVGTNASGLVTNSYATGSIVASMNGGGLIGSMNTGGVIDSYYDLETTGQADNGGGLGLATEDMLNPSSYEDWDFTNTWAIDSERHQRNDGYPYLSEIQKVVAYDGNGHTGGEPPFDPKLYAVGMEAEVLGNSGELTKTGYTFSGWQVPAPTAAREQQQLKKRLVYLQDDLLAIRRDMVLYAVWLSSAAALTSTIGTASAGGTANESLTGIPPGTTISALKAAITPAPDAEFEIYEADGTTVATVLATGNKIIVTAEDGVTKVAYIVTVNVPQTPGDSATTGGSGSAPLSTAEPTVPAASVQILVNGKSAAAGTESVSKANNRTTTTVKVDAGKLQDKLETEGDGMLVSIPVPGISDVVVGELNGRIVKNMGQKQAVLEVSTDRAVYTLPAKLLDMDAIAAQFGPSVALEDIAVQIELAEPEADEASMANTAAANGSFTLIVPPIKFTIRAVYEGTTVEVTTFNHYVERKIAIPDDVDPASVTTVVVLEPDGTPRQVPTRIEQVDGKFYAVVSSMTNSLYAVVGHPQAFDDVRGHWAEEFVNDMGSRMIINGVGPGRFDPDRDITRAEFAAVVVRGLGLRPEAGEATPFADILANDWHSGAIRTAVSYGLVNGFADGTFRPNEKVTREQAMTILAKAMTVTNLKTRLPVQAEAATLGAFADAGQISAWARGGVADSVLSGVVSGRSGLKLAPKQFMTRAEAAATIRRLLQSSGLL